MLAVDTNILVYAEGVGDDDRQARAKSLLRALPEGTIVLPAQVLGELFSVLTRKAHLPAETVRDRLGDYERTVSIAPTLPSTLSNALDLAVQHRLQIFDSIILAASAEAGCRMLLSEDMGDGFVWRGVTVVNPFAATPHPLLADALRR